MQLSRRLVTLLLLIVPALISTRLTGQIYANPQDSTALVDFYKSTDGPHWSSQEGWLTNPVQAWGGVQLDLSGRVTDIRLQYNLLRGNLPVSFISLTKLKSLDLTGNDLSNLDLSALAGLTSLEQLVLDECGITGRLPSSIANLGNLQGLSLSENNFTGEIPAAIGNMSTLEGLYLDHNKLSGVVPAGIGNLSGMVELNLSYNMLSGPVPAGIHNWQKLEIIELEVNLFNFDGMENIDALASRFALYESQGQLKIHKHDGKLAVSAGGNVANNTYTWQDVKGYVETDITGDSTFTPPVCGDYYVRVTNALAPYMDLNSDTAAADCINISLVLPPESMRLQNGKLKIDASNLPATDWVRGAATDGVTKILLVAKATKPIKFSIDGTNSGSLYSLSDQSSIGTDVTVSPDNNGKVVAVYEAPDNYGTDDPIGKSILFKAAYADEPNDVSNIPFAITTPPVVLVHGMWSGPDVWTSGGFVDALTNAGFDAPVLADYASFSASTFNPVKPSSLRGRTAVKSAIFTAINNYKAEGIAATQVDVVGHSLGGLMTRSVSQQEGFLSSASYGKGAVHKLITLGTPHRGSPFGPELISSRNNKVLTPAFILQGVFGVMKLEDIMKAAGMPIGSCHEDFAIESEGILALKQTPPFMAHAITGDYKGNSTADEQTAGLVFMKLLCSAALNHSFSEVMGSRCSPFAELPNDLVVPFSSQKGYIPYNSNFFGTAHSIPAYITETNSKNIQKRVIELLLSKDLSEFAAGFPAPSSFPLEDCDNASQRSAGNREQHASARPPAILGTEKVQISSPTRMQSFTQNSNAQINLSFAASGGAKPASAVFIISKTGRFPATIGGNNQTTITLPQNSITGLVTVVLLAKDSSGLQYADTLSILIKPSGALTGIYPDQNAVQLDSATRDRQLYVQGFYEGGSSDTYSDITTGASGTTYLLKRPSNGIVTLSADGLLQAVKPGTDTVTISNNGFTTIIPISVDSNFLQGYTYPNTITFDSIPATASSAAPFILTGNCSAGEDIIYSLISGPAVVAGGVVYLTGTGTVAIKAEAPYNPYFSAAQPITRTFISYAGTIYTFTGSGDWSDAANWSGSVKPPAVLPAGSQIIIDPAVNGECILSIAQTIQSGASITVAAGKKFRIPGNLDIQQ